MQFLWQGPIFSCRIRHSGQPGIEGPRRLCNLSINGHIRAPSSYGPSRKINTFEARYGPQGVFCIVMTFWREEYFSGSCQPLMKRKRSWNMQHSLIRKPKSLAPKYWTGSQRTVGFSFSFIATAIPMLECSILHSHCTLHVAHQIRWLFRVAVYPVLWPSWLM